MPEEVKNIGASVRARLLRISKEKGQLWPSSWFATNTKTREFYFGIDRGFQEPGKPRNRGIEDLRSRTQMRHYRNSVSLRSQTKMRQIGALKEFPVSSRHARRKPQSPQQFEP